MDIEKKLRIINQQKTPRKNKGRDEILDFANRLRKAFSPPSRKSLERMLEVPVESYDKHRFDVDGYDRDGYDSSGYNKDGYNRDGEYKYKFDRDGYDRDGCNIDGIDRQGNKRTSGKGVKILTPQQMLTRLPISLAQIQEGNDSQKLKNEIR